MRIARFFENLPGLQRPLHFEQQPGFLPCTIERQWIRFSIHQHLLKLCRQSRRTLAISNGREQQQNNTLHGALRLQLAY